MIKTSSKTKAKELTKFQALNEYVQIEPVKETQRGGPLLAQTAKPKTATAKVLSVGEGRALPDGTFVKPPVEVGDVIIVNPHLVQEVESEGEMIFIINTIGIYGKRK